MKIFIFLALSFLLASCAGNGIKDKTPEEKKSDLYYGHGTQALIDKDYTTALSHLQKALELSPKDEKIHNNLGMAYFFKGESAKAITHLQKSIDLDDSNSDARVNLAGIYYSQGKLDLALKQYEMVTKNLTYQHQFRTYYNMALILEKQNKPSLAREYIAKSVKENQEYCPAYFLEGKMNEKVRDWKGAFDSYLNATKGKCYQEPAPHFAQAQMLIKLGKYSEAREKLEMVMTEFNRTPYAPIATQELNALNRMTPNDEDDFLQKAKIEMDKIRGRESEQTFQGTSF